MAELVLTAEKSKQSTSVLHARFGSGPSSAPPPSRGEHPCEQRRVPCFPEAGFAQQLSLSCRSRRRQERYILLPVLCLRSGSGHINYFVYSPEINF